MKKIKRTQRIKKMKKRSNLKKMNFHKKKYIRYGKGIAAMILAAMLASCTGMNSQFSCPMRPGVMCASLDQVNTDVNDGSIGSNNSSGDSSTSSTSTNNSGNTDPQTMGAGMTTDSHGDYVPVINAGDPLRYAETVFRIWVAPYQDANGNYYPSTTFFTVVKPGHWIDNPATEVTNVD